MQSSSPGPRYLMRWDFRRSGRIDREVVSTPHRLAELSYFRGEGLADLIDRFPRYAIVVEEAQGGEAGLPPTEHRVGSIGRLRGQQIIDEVRHGQYSVILRDIGKHSVKLSSVLNRLNQEMMECSESLRIRKLTGDLYLASPGLSTPLRCDTDPTVHWQITGNQSLIHYPVRVIDSHQRIQRLLCKNRDAAYRNPMNYDPSIEAVAWEQCLEAGLMQSILPATPHRIITHRGISLTLITRYQTESSLRSDDVLLANDWLNRVAARTIADDEKMTSQSPQQQGHRPQLAKRTIAAFVRRRHQHHQPSPDPVSFSMDDWVTTNDDTLFRETPTLAASV
jgi:hypothetical protein